MDSTADLMVRCLAARNVGFERVHPKDFPQQVAVAFRCSGEAPPDGRLAGPGFDFAWDEIRSVWYRRPDPFEFPAQLTKEEKDFAYHESTAVFTGLWRSLDVQWVNHPDRIRVAETKALQLKRARELGARVPRTLCTNDPAALHDFYDELGGRVVYKSMTQGVLGFSRQESIYTTRLDAAHLARSELVKASPGQFQEEVPKACDLRLTVIGETVFAVEIHPPEDQSGNVDWRRHSGPDLKHVVHRLPAEVERFCLALARSFGLLYAAIDMVLTPEDDYVFLEINPNGQFGWLENMTGLPFIETLADLLAAPLA